MVLEMFSTSLTPRARFLKLAALTISFHWPQLEQNMEKSLIGIETRVEIGFGWPK